MNDLLDYFGFHEKWEPDWETEPKPEDKSKAEVKPEDKSKAEAKPEDKSKAEVKSKPKAEAKPKAKPEAKPEAEPANINNINCPSFNHHYNNSNNNTNPDNIHKPYFSPNSSNFRRISSATSCDAQDLKAGEAIEKSIKRKYSQLNRENSFGDEDLQNVIQQSLIPADAKFDLDNEINRRSEERYIHDNASSSNYGLNNNSNPPLLNRTLQKTNFESLLFDRIKHSIHYTETELRKIPDNKLLSLLQNQANWFSCEFQRLYLFINQELADNNDPNSINISLADWSLAVIPKNKEKLDTSITNAIGIYVHEYKMTGKDFSDRKTLEKTDIDWPKHYYKVEARSTVFGTLKRLIESCHEHYSTNTVTSHYYMKYAGQTGTSFYNRRKDAIYNGEPVIQWGKAYNKQSTLYALTKNSDNPTPEYNLDIYECLALAILDLHYENLNAINVAAGGARGAAVAGAKAGGLATKIKLAKESNKPMFYCYHCTGWFSSEFRGKYSSQLDHKCEYLQNETSRGSRPISIGFARNTAKTGAFNKTRCTKHNDTNPCVELITIAKHKPHFIEPKDSSWKELIK